MKKLLFLALCMVSMTSFANSKTTAVVGLPSKSSTAVTEKCEFLNIEELLRYCITRTNYWYTGETYVGMDGETYEVYEVEVTTTCYTI